MDSSALHSRNTVLLLVMVIIIRFFKSTVGYIKYKLSKQVDRNGMKQFEFVHVW